MLFYTHVVQIILPLMAQKYTPPDNWALDENRDEGTGEAKKNACNDYLKD